MYVEIPTELFLRPNREDNEKISFIEHQHVTVSGIKGQHLIKTKLFVVHPTAGRVEDDGHPLLACHIYIALNRES